jgi:hypothetical protein
MLIFFKCRQPCVNLQAIFGGLDKGVALAKAWEHYEKALNLWASITGCESCTQALSCHCVESDLLLGGSHQFSSAFHGNAIPISVFENAVKIANLLKIISCQFSLSRLLQNRLNQSPYMHERVTRAFEQAISGHAKHDWLDDALAQYGNWLASRGKPVKEKNGNLEVSSRLSSSRESLASFNQSL